MHRKFQVTSIWNTIMKRRSSYLWYGNPYSRKHGFDDNSGLRSSACMTFTLSKYGRFHYNDVIMGMIESLIASLTIVYSSVYSDADQRKHQSSASPHKWPVMWKKCLHLMTSSCPMSLSFLTLHFNNLQHFSFKFPFWQILLQTVLKFSMKWWHICCSLAYEMYECESTLIPREWQRYLVAFVMFDSIVSHVNVI